MLFAKVLHTALIQHFWQLLPPLVALLITPIDTHEHDRSRHHTHAAQSQTGAETRMELGLLPLQEDVGPDESPSISEADNAAESDSALVALSDVDGNPDDRKWHDEVGSSGHKEESHVANTRGLGLRDFHDEPDRNGAEANHAEEVALAEIFGGISEGNRVDSGSKIDRDGADLRSCSRVSDALQDRGLEARDGVGILGGAHIYQNGDPDLPVFEELVDALRG